MTEHPENSGPEDLQAGGVGRDNVIVVGVDGSSHSMAAARWGAAEASSRKSALHLVHAYSPPIQTFVGPGMPPLDIYDAQRSWGETVLEQASTAVRGEFPDLTVTTHLRRDLTVSALLREGERALMTVVGAEGNQHFAGALIGSMANRLAIHGNGPVVVVRTDQSEATRSAEKPVVVGLDGSAGSDHALAFAFEEASFRGVKLVAIRVWSDTEVDRFFRPYPMEVDFSVIEQDEALLLSEQLTGWSEKYPDVEVRKLVLRGRPTATLLGACNASEALAASPGLVVVGSRGRGGFAGMLLGSTSQALITHALCPVCVVHHRS